MTREMVCVRLYEDGTYEVNDIDSSYATQRLFGLCEKGTFDAYYCRKDKWRCYLLKLIDTSRIDKEIKELQKRKRDMQKLKDKISKELEDK